MSQPLDKLYTLIAPGQRGVCALCNLIHICQVHHLPPYHPTIPGYDARRPKLFSAQLRVSGCAHVFHEACLFSWLSEGLSGSTGAEGGGLEAVPEEVRRIVEANKCGTCLYLQKLVRETKMGVLDLEGSVDGIVRNKYEDML